MAPPVTNGLLAHYDADALVLNDGDAVTTWPDESGNGNDLTGGSPTYRTNQLNGLPVVDFDGTDDNLNVTWPSVESQPNTFFAVVSQPTSDKVTYDGATSSDRNYLDRNVNDVWRAFAGNSITSSNTDIGPLIAAVVYDGANSLLRIKRTQVASGDVGTDGSSGLTLLARHDDTKHSDGIAAEVLVYNKRLTSTEIDDVEAYLNDKWFGEPTTITFDPHTVLLKHRPLFEGVFSPHTVVLNHFKAVPLQPHIVNLLHRGNVLKGDDSEEGQATALRKLLGYGWGVPDPAGSANEKIETPRESWPIHRFHEAERLLRQEGVEEPTAQALGDALRRLGEDIHLDVKENLQRYEWHANAHTHPGLAGAEGTPVGPAEALFTVSGGGALIRRLAGDGSVFWSRGSNYGDLAVDPVERRVYAIGRADGPNGGTLVNTIDRVVSYDFDGIEQWNVDLHQRLGDASETVWAFTLARDRSALYTIYNDGSQFGVVRIGTSDGSVSVVGKDTPSSTDFYPTATFDTDGDYLYFSDRAFHGGNRGRIIKFSLGDGHIVWEMSPDLANQHDCPLCATDTLLWAQKENGKVILVDKASGGIDSIVDLSGKDGAAGGNLWKDFHNTNSLYVLGTNFSVPDTWLYRLYPLGGVIQAEELKFLETIDMGRVIRDGEGNFFLGGGSGSTSHLMKLSPSLEVKWRIDGPSPRNFCTDQGRSVHWG